ncbi:ImmA/IrrE family metallo-endopeptidase [Celeribacter sp.]|uniref:ImmA/IrrE family metallo-endopeptidase n=1 Tax=Celeribacter sp. TaxID=1890673 RepID=UPI003A8CCB6E
MTTESSQVGNDAGVAPRSLPIPTRVTKQKIQDFAEGVRDQCNLGSGFDIVDLVKANNGSVSYIGAFSKDQTDSIIVNPDNSFEIRLSSSSSSLRDNFTLAHELGHYLLHWPKVRDAGSENGMRATRAVNYEDSDLVRCEWEANWFAAAFLMPKDEFTDVVKSSGLDAASSIFGVSKMAAQTRASDLGIDGI